MNNFLGKWKYRFACFRTVGRSMGLETIAYQLRYYKCCCYEIFVSCAGSVVEIRGAESFPFKLQWKKGRGRLFDKWRGNSIRSNGWSRTGWNTKKRNLRNRYKTANCKHATHVFAARVNRTRGKGISGNRHRGRKYQLAEQIPRVVGPGCIETLRRSGLSCAMTRRRGSAREANTWITTIERNRDRLSVRSPFFITFDYTKRRDERII